MKYSLTSIMRLFVVSLILSFDAQSHSLQESLRSIRAFTAQFTQTDPSGQTKQTGEMAFLRPGYLLWKTHPPENRVIVVNQDKLLIYDPDLEQVTIEPYQQRSAHDLLSMLQNDVWLVENYHIDAQIGSDRQHYVLTNQDETAEFKHIQFLFNQGKLVQIAWQDQLDQKITLGFHHIQMNHDIEKSLFDLQLPQGTEVLDHTQ